MMMQEPLPIFQKGSSSNFFPSKNYRPLKEWGFIALEIYIGKNISL
jgi:hypothetical protein